MSNPIDGLLTKEQTDLIFENMSDGVLMVNEDGIITYMNSACAKLLHVSAPDVIRSSFTDLFLQNKKNRAFNKLFKNSMEKGQLTDKTTVKYTPTDVKDSSYLTIDISLMQQENTSIRRKEPFQGMIVLIEDVTDSQLLQQHDHDCAYIFAGLILCISMYLAAWSFCRFTLHIPLTTHDYTLMIEVITFVLFLEIAFCTSFSLREIGLIPYQPQRDTYHRHDLLSGDHPCKAYPVACRHKDQGLLYRWLSARCIHLYLHCIYSGISRPRSDPEERKIPAACKIPEAAQHLPDLAVVLPDASALWFLFHAGCIPVKPCTWCNL